MTFDEFVIKLDRTDRDWWHEVKDQIDVWNEGGKLSPEDTGGPRFDSLEELLQTRNEEFWLTPEYSLQWIWEIYLAVNEMTAAGVDFDDAEEAASTQWCHGRCGRDWGDVGGPSILNKDWRRIVRIRSAKC
jgi:hypothetical protein